MYGFQVSLAHDTRDNPFLATEGHLIQASFEQVIGTYPLSARASIEFSQYFKLYERPDGSGRHVLSLSATLGCDRRQHADLRAVLRRRLLDASAASRSAACRRGSTPATRPYRSSAATSSCSPRSSTCSPSRPTTCSAAWCSVDAGTVEPTISNWSDNYRVAPGFGLRITIPMMGPAPIALDFAFPVC